MKRNGPFIFISLLIVALIVLAVFREKKQKVILKKFSTPACRLAYEELFSRGTLEIRMVFGYKDARPARFVADRYEQMLFIQQVTSDCSGERQDCGFEASRTSDDEEAESFVKSIADPDELTKKVKLIVAHSSVGADDDNNRGNPFQKWQSDQAQKTFEEGLTKADIVFYNGHSRSGGGPDFSPPQLAANGHVNYPWYKEHQPGIQAMENLFSKADLSYLQILGLFSCASDQLFTERVQNAKSGVGVIASGQLLYFSDALENSLNALSALLEMKCRPQIDGIFNADMKLQGFL